MSDKWRWAKRECTGAHYVYRGQDMDAREICVIYTGREDDCRLIAAAPTMIDYISKRAAAGDQEAKAIIAATLPCLH